MEKVESPTVAICNGKRTILLGTYNYMGMTFDPDVDRRRQAGARRVRLGHHRQPRPQRHLRRPQGGRAGAQGLLRDGPRHGLLDRLPGQPRHHLDDRRQGRLHHPRHRQPRLDLRRLRARQRRRSCRSATTTSKRSKSASKRIPEGAGKLVVLEGVYSMLGDIAPLKEMVAVVEGRTARWCWSTRPIRWASSASTAAASPRRRA